MAILSKTPAEKRAIELTVAALRQYDNMKRAYEQGLRDFWSDPRFTPQELADALGSDASDLFRLHGGLKAAILSVNPEEQLSSVSDYGTFIVNEDGTLTITSTVN